MEKYNYNNLKDSLSPYLRQHKDNPVNWQEWSRELINYAKNTGKLIFISIGYSTCHWCHVMADEAFSDKETADFINSNFIPVKVDREQRPDIDEYVMTYIMAMEQSGGWPLNAVLTPDIKPVYAFTYAPIKPRSGLNSIKEILEQVLEHYLKAKDKITEFKFKSYFSENTDEIAIMQTLGSHFDWDYGGFGKGSKFASSSALLFMLYYYPVSNDKYLDQMLKMTLDSILKLGLHDHLAGGFFRYTADRTWTVPHFEKMLTDQAMLLWVYSLAYHVFNDENYRITAVKISECLMSVFKSGNLFFSGIDADTGHKEGDTYLWKYEELKSILTEKEFKEFEAVYEIRERGNFASRNHLIKKEKAYLTEIEKKLLNIRNQKNQPFIDQKIITSWNCLAGIAFIHAFRYIKESISMEFIKNFANELLNKHFIDNKLYHTSFNGQLSGQEFLEDYALMLLFLTYYYEEFHEKKDTMIVFYNLIGKFKDENGWMQSNNEDFYRIPAGTFDNPVPSVYAAAESAVLRTDILLEKNYRKCEFKKALQQDFYNITAMTGSGMFHIIESPSKIEWDILPVNTIQLKGDTIKHCYKGECKFGTFPKKDYKKN